MNTTHPILGLGPLGPTEMLIIFMLILLLFGAKRLPTLARSIGKSLGEFRKAKEEFHEEIVKGEDEGAKEFDTKRTAPPRPRPQQIGTEISRTPVSAPLENPPASAPSPSPTSGDSTSV